MRPYFALLLLAFGLLTACHPVVPLETLAAFAPARLPLTNSIAGALQPAEAETGFVLLYPELRTAAAPRWLRAAVRVTYRVNSAVFVDPRYPRDDRNNPNPTPSATGIVQYDVVAQNRRSVVFISTLINPTIQGQPPSPLSYGVSVPGSGEFWFSPVVLANAESAASEVFLVSRMPMTVEGIEHQEVVRMQTNTTTDQGRGEEVWAFDSATGLLVFYRQALFYPNGDQRSGITMTLLGRRQVRLPWRNATMPDWVRTGMTLEFSGSQSYDTGIPPMTTMPMSSVSRITRTGASWSEHLQQVYLYGMDSGSNSTATGTGQLYGGYWLPSEAIALLEKGDLLDEDPWTGIRVEVVEANRQQVVLAASGPGHLTQLFYDARDGRLTGIYMAHQNGAGTSYITLQEVR